ncbi:MAG TPA: ABC transporter substrate-binding protein [Actinomycetes bacterium]|nr:ABC transporter substrate-binding protein [Actinomycetes bacterium]
MDSRIARTDTLLTCRYPRREFIKASGVVAGLALWGPLLAACGKSEGGASGTATVANQLSWIKNVEFGGHWIADDQGYLKEQNIQPQWITGGPNAPRSEGVVVGGQADVGMSSFMETTVRAIIEGAPIKMVGAFFQHSPLALMSTQARPIRTAADMAGKRLGGPPFLQPNIDSLFRANGMKVDYKFVPVGGTEPDPLLNNEIDALYVFITNQPLIYEQAAKEKPVLLLDSENKFDVYSSIYFVRTKDIEGARRDALVRFFRGLIKGWEHNLDDPDLGARLAVEKFGKGLGLSLDQQAKENRTQNTLGIGDITQEKGLLRLSQEFIEQKAYKSFEAAGVKGLPEISKIADFSLFDEVFGEENRFYLDPNRDLTELVQSKYKAA